MFIRIELSIDVFSKLSSFPFILKQSIILFADSFGEFKMRNFESPVLLGFIIVSEKLGHSNFGVISSIVGFGYIWGFALAPATSGYIFDEFGSNALIACTFATALIGTLIFSSSIYIESKYYRPLTK